MLTARYSHWPDCNWCSKGSTHYINSNDTYDDPPDETDGPNGDDYPDDSTNYPDYPDNANSEGGSASTAQTIPAVEDLKNEIAAINFFVKPGGSQRMKRVHRMRALERRIEEDGPQETGSPACFMSSSGPIVTGSSSDTSASVEGLPSMPTTPPNPDVPRVPGLLPTTSTSNKVAGTQAPAQAPAKTQDSQSKCTPSPTKSLAPSASECRRLFTGLNLTDLNSRSLDDLPICRA